MSEKQKLLGIVKLPHILYRDRGLYLLSSQQFFYKTSLIIVLYHAQQCMNLPWMHNNPSINHFSPQITFTQCFLPFCYCTCWGLNLLPKWEVKMQIWTPTHADFKPSSLINPSEQQVIMLLSKTKTKYIKQLCENMFSLWNGKSLRALLCTASLEHRAALWFHGGPGPVCAHIQSDAQNQPQPGEFHASFLSHWFPVTTRKTR